MCWTQESMTHACLLDLTKEVDQDSIKEMAPWTYYLLSKEDEQKRFDETIFAKEK